MTTTPRTDKHHHDAKAGYFADEYVALLQDEANEKFKLGKAYCAASNETIKRAIDERDQLIKAVDELANNRIVENILADGRPHGSNRTYPDGCECDDCTTYDQLTKALAAYSLLPHVIAKKGTAQ